MHTRAAEGWGTLMLTPTKTPTSRPQSAVKDTGQALALSPSHPHCNRALPPTLMAADGQATCYPLTPPPLPDIAMDTCDGPPAPSRTRRLSNAKAATPDAAIVLATASTTADAVTTTRPTAPAEPTTVFLDASVLAVGGDATPRQPPSPAAVNPPAASLADVDTENGLCYCRCQGWGNMEA